MMRLKDALHDDKKGKLWWTRGRCLPCLQCIIALSFIVCTNKDVLSNFQFKPNISNPGEIDLKVKLMWTSSLRKDGFYI